MTGSILGSAVWACPTTGVMARAHDHMNNMLVGHTHLDRGILEFHKAILELASAIDALVFCC